MANCVDCGSWIPDDQSSSTCSMCYGDISHGKDGYYEAWARRQETMREEAGIEAEEYPNLIKANNDGEIPF